MIEKGRHAANKRYCSLCNYGIDDEVHFLIECTKFQSLRNRMFAKIHHMSPPSFNVTFSNQDKFAYLLQTDNMDILISVVRFIHVCCMVVILQTLHLHPHMCHFRCASLNSFFLCSFFFSNWLMYLAWYTDVNKSILLYSIKLSSLDRNNKMVQYDIREAYTYTKYMSSQQNQV